MEGNNNAGAFVASVINQKSVNQNAQQVLVAVAAQIQKVYESQVGFSTNDEMDKIKI
ncbi:hypothetical protein [Halothermothrix orenii]|uniref:Uncharacterized protein n=1 Tax=Halothermothrix orenii (strain H 168 / OCM 544 / DSM 9562) TaxID=373903 RepID=B8CX70_HALOH|nr:hypothetical protein [Halothermothrix orenii]ACL69889.1 hypothetical protein Hore_11370 [Halothermothrix orenii H 168]